MPRRGTDTAGGLEASQTAAHFNGADRELLVRIAERQSYMAETLASLTNEKLDARYVRREEFGPVRALIFGAAGAMLFAIMGAVVALVVAR